MPKWVNSDGLIVKFGSDEGDPLKGGLIKGSDGIYRINYDILYTDLLSATSAILGSASVLTDGAIGVMVPKNMRIKAVETVVTTAFTVSAGLVTSATLEMGLKKWADLTTTISDSGLFTTSVTGTVLGLGTVGTRTYTTIGSTGVGSLVGTTLTDTGVVCLRNSTHGTNTFSAGKLNVTIEAFYP